MQTSGWGEGNISSQCLRSLQENKQMARAHMMQTLVGVAGGGGGGGGRGSCGGGGARGGTLNYNAYVLFMKMTQPVLASASSTAVHRFGPFSFFVDDDDDDVVATSVEKDVAASPFAPAAKDTDDVVGAAAEVDGVVADVVTGVAEPFTVAISISVTASACLSSGSDVDG